MAGSDSNDVNFDLRPNVTEAKKQLDSLEAQIDRIIAKSRGLGVGAAPLANAASPTDALATAGLLSQRPGLQNVTSINSALSGAGLLTNPPIHSTLSTAVGTKETWKQISRTNPIGGVAVAAAGADDTLEDVVVLASSNGGVKSAAKAGSKPKPKVPKPKASGPSFITYETEGFKAGPLTLGRAGLTLSPTTLVTRLGPAAVAAFATIFAAKGFSQLGANSFSGVVSALEESEKTGKSLGTAINEKLGNLAARKINSAFRNSVNFLTEFSTGNFDAFATVGALLVNSVAGKEAASDFIRNSERNKKEFRFIVDELTDGPGSTKNFNRAIQEFERRKNEALKSAEHAADNVLFDITDALQGLGFSGTAQQIDKDIRKNVRENFRRKTFAEINKQVDTAGGISAVLDGIANGDQGEGS